jgi:hypothetical protein
MAYSQELERALTLGSLAQSQKLGSQPVQNS